MSIRKLTMMSVVSLAALSCAANADTITFGGPFGPAPTNTVENFDTLTPGNPLGTYSDSFATFTGGGIVEGPPTIPGVSAEPFGDASPYLSIQQGQTETITFSNPWMTIGFFWGSVDNYNTVHLNFANGTSEDITPPAPGGGDQSSSASNAYWELIRDSGNSGIISVVLGTGNTNAFEIDNFFVGGRQGGGENASAPLPAALPLFAGGLGLISLFARRKRKAAV